jgi:hypothetical protein
MKEFAFNVSIPLLSPWIAIAFASIGIGLLNWIWFMAKYSRWQNAASSLFRALAVGVIVFFLFDPKFIFSETRTMPAKAVVLLDSSESMKFTTPGESSSRLVSAANLAEKKLIPEMLSGNCSVSRIAFANDAVPVPVTEKFTGLEKTESTGTDMSSALSSAGVSSVNSPDKIILISDGFWNSGSAPVSVAGKAVSGKTEIHCLYPDPVRNEKKEKVREDGLKLHVCGSQIGTAGKSIPIGIVIESTSGYVGDLGVKIKIRGKDRTYPGTIRFNSGDFAKTAIFAIKLPDEPGELILDVSVDGWDAVKTESLEVTARPKPKEEKHRNVVYFDTDLPFQYRFVCDSFLRNDFFKFKGYSLLCDEEVRKDLAEAFNAPEPENMFRPSRQVWIENAAKLLDDDKYKALSRIFNPNDIKEANVIILGGFNERIPSGTVEKMLASVEKGANLFLLADENMNKWGMTGLRGVIPGLEVKAKKIELCRFAPLSKEQNPLKFDIPEKSSRFAVFQLASPVPAGFETVLYAQSNQGDKNYPLIMRKSHGLGNIFLVMSDGTWHLDFYDFRKFRSVYREFWPKLSVFRLFQDASLKLAAKNHCILSGGESVMLLEASVPDAKRKEYSLKWGGLNEKPAFLDTFDISKGYSEIHRILDKPGKHTFEISKSDGSIVQRERVVCLEKQQRAREVQSSEIDIKTLEKIAEAGGGIALPFSRIDELMDRLSKTSAKTVTQRTERKFSDQWGWMLLLIILLACDWSLRKLYICKEGVQ